MKRMGGTGDLPGGFSIECANERIKYAFEQPRKFIPSRKVSDVRSLGNLWFYESDDIFDTLEETKQYTKAYSPDVIIIKIDLSDFDSSVNPRLGYKDPTSKEWVYFERQFEAVEEGTRFLYVKFNFWHPDPGIGWGFL